MVYRIYTEDLNRRDVEVLTAKYFPGFTIIEATGFWKLKREKTIIIELVILELQNLDIMLLCKEIKELNKQGSILVTKTECVSDFI